MAEKVYPRGTAGYKLGSGPWWAGRVHPAVALESHTIGGWAPVGRTMPDVVEVWKKLNKAVGNEAITRAAKDYENVLFKKMFRVPLWQANVPFAVNQRVKSYDPRCRA